MFRIRKPIEEVWHTTVKHNGLAKWYKGGRHKGIDLRTRCSKYPNGIGTPIRAAASGKWKIIKNDPLMGLTVTLEHKDGYQSVYGHLNSTTYKNGYDTVEARDVIGFSGKSGALCWGPHLHFEILDENGKSVDPEIYIKYGEDLVSWARARAVMRTEKDGSINLLIKGGITKINKENCWNIISNNTWGISEKDYESLLDLL